MSRVIQVGEVQRVIARWFAQHPDVILEAPLGSSFPPDLRDLHSPVTHFHTRGRRLVVELDGDQDSELVVIAGIEHALASDAVLEFSHFDYCLVAQGDRGPSPRVIDGGGTVRFYEPRAFLRARGITV